MIQFSNNGMPVELEILSGNLLFIDPLYLQKISDCKNKIEVPLLVEPILFIQSIEKLFFPYGGGSLIGYKKIENSLKIFSFSLQSMDDFDDETYELEVLSVEKKVTSFSCDSGIFLILDLDNFNELMNAISFDEIVEASNKNRLQQYVHKINERTQNKGWAVVVSPGINSGFVFQGSGSFVLKD